MLALIDGDIIAWKSATSTTEFQEAVKRANELVYNILQATNSEDFRLILSNPVNFRKSVYPEYKGQRPPTPDVVKEMKQYLLDHSNAEVAPEGLEADDLMAILQTKDTVICTIDKDLLQVEGWHYQWELRGTSVNGKEWVKEARFFEQTELEGTRLFYEQCLKGDASDNVKGVSGIGEGKAKKLLANCNSEIEFVNVCLESYSSEEEFLMNAQCLYILRSLDDSYLTRYDKLFSNENMENTSENNSNET